MTGSLYHFRCMTPLFPLQDSVLVVFSGPTDFDTNAIIGAISEETKRSLAPEAAYFIFPDKVAEKAAIELTSNEAALAALPSDAAIAIYGYDKSGSVSLKTTLRGRPEAQFPEDHVRRQGLTVLFWRHKAVLDAGPTAHFVRPSLRPSPRFLRASHALADGAEIYFAALWLLQVFPDDVEFVHLDTSAIASVVFACLLLKQPDKQPIVRSFQSYEGFKKHPFDRDRADMVVISASQSGTMARDVAGKVRTPDRIVTLFSSAEAAPGTRVLCDIRHDPDSNVHGFKPARELGDLSNSRPIRLISEHFIAEPEPSRSIVPGRAHAPDVVKEVLNHFVGKKVISALKVDTTGEERISVWIDMERLKDQKLFKHWIRRLVTRSIPAATRAIIVTNTDPDAKIVADAIQQEVNVQGGTLQGLQHFSIQDLETNSHNWPQAYSPVVVAAGPSGRGAELLNVSRALRRFAKESHRIFVSPFVTAHSQRSIDLLRTNLKQPSHVFESPFELVLDRKASGESWHRERVALMGAQDENPAAEKRLESLNDYPDGRTDGLFLDGPDGPLKLRDNFAFWEEGTDCSVASQADVFATIAAIMENARSDSTSLEKRIVNDVQTHTVLDAETFARYNDGIIQAAFLRSSSPLELNYQGNEQSSRLMLSLLLQMIEYRERQQGEALAEFLMAIATGRLRLVQNDYGRLLTALSGSLAGASDMSIWLACQLVSGHLPSKSD